MTMFNILAFFNVVASSQISPHFINPNYQSRNRAAKIYKKNDIQIFGCINL